MIIFSTPSRNVCKGFCLRDRPPHPSFPPKQTFFCRQAQTDSKIRGESQISGKFSELKIKISNLFRKFTKPPQKVAELRAKLQIL